VALIIQVGPPDQDQGDDRHGDAEATTMPTAAGNISAAVAPCRTRNVMIHAWAMPPKAKSADSASR
jgi:hypothetical protein